MEQLLNGWEKVIDFDLLNSTLSKIPIPNICPEKQNVFRAFKLCSLDNCKVVFLGQDPYPQKGVATGILFGNNRDVEESNLSPSLRVIKEAVIDYTKPHNLPIYFDNSLESWAESGVLMINSALTVEMNKIGSHTQLWRPFMSKLIKNLSSSRKGIVYVLFGEQAQTFEPYIDKQGNYILKEKHPAFYARSHKLMPSLVFYKINDYLRNLYGEEIVWYKEYEIREQEN